MNDTNPSSAADRLRKVTSSAGWAAWGDAVGFISELTSGEGLNKRLGGKYKELSEPVAWKRRVGGKFGVDADLPYGTYSDDTQLRLSVSRAISSGRFDVEAFALVELTTWPAYALGGGRATKAAASNLSKPGVTWFNNFYNGWDTAGGNGAAMRVQPHAWAHDETTDDAALFADVFVDAITTHGHPHAIMGALLNASYLSCTLVDCSVPTVDQWDVGLARVADPSKILDSRVEVATGWKPSWERIAGQPFIAAWAAAYKEAERALGVAREYVELIKRAGTSGDDARMLDAYRSLLGALDLFSPSLRGSGLLTVVASLTLAAALPNDPQQALVTAARAIGSDTDSIATMAGALIGAGTGIASPPVLDATYIAAESERLCSIASGEIPATFPYPDLLRWSSPRSQIEAVGIFEEDRLALSGIAPLSALSDQIFISREAVWQWYTTPYGQSMLLKRRVTPNRLPRGNWPRGTYTPKADLRQDGNSQSGEGNSRTADRILSSSKEDVRMSAIEELQTVLGLDRAIFGAVETTVDVDQMLQWIVRRGMQDTDIGYAVRRLGQTGTIEQQIALTTALRAYSIRSTRQVLSQMTLDQLESLVRQAVLSEVSWKVVTSTRRTDSVDLMISDPNSKRASIVVQVKQMTRPLEPSDIQELVRTIDLESFRVALLISGASVTSEARRLAIQDGRISVLDGDQMAELANRKLGKMTLSPDMHKRPDSSSRAKQAVAASRFEVYMDRGGKYRFKLVAENGKTVAEGEAYETREAARNACLAVRQAAAAASFSG